jgi:hypothetical protein
VIWWLVAIGAWLLAVLWCWALGRAAARGDAMMEQFRQTDGARDARGLRRVQRNAP